MVDKQAEIWSSENRMKAGMRFFRRWESLTWGDIEDFTMACVRDAKQRDILLGQFDGYQAHGVSSPAAVGSLKRNLRNYFRASFETDPITAMAAIVVPREDDVPFSWNVFTRDPLTANFNEGDFGRISGPPRKGKTNVGCEMMDRWIRKGHVAFSNIHMDVEGHVYTPTGSSLIRAAIQARRNRKKWLWFLDEAFVAGFSAQQWMTKRSMDLDRFIRVIGKLEGNMVIIEQRPEAVPRSIVAWARNMFFAHEPGVVSIDLRGPTLEWRQDVKDFPKSSLPYETSDISGFRIDVDMDLLFQHVAGRDDQLQAMLDFVDNPPPKRNPVTGERPRRPDGTFVSRDTTTTAG